MKTVASLWDLREGIGDLKVGELTIGTPVNWVTSQVSHLPSLHFSLFISKVEMGMLYDGKSVFSGKTLDSIPQSANCMNFYML